MPGEEGFSNLLASFNAEQHVKEPIHKFGHILDYVISRPDDDLLDDCDVDSLLSDHHDVHFTLKYQKPHPIRKIITFLQTKSMAIDGFKKDILESDLYKAPALDLDAKVQQYDEILKTLLDKHPPEMSKKVAEKESQPWVNDNKSGVYLALIDLSAACDTVDHEMLLTLLENSIGIKGPALNWFQTILSGRTQCISIDH